MNDADLTRRLRNWPSCYSHDSWVRTICTEAANALEERGAQLVQALRERSPCRKCSGRGYTLAYDGITRKQCESCNGTKMELRLVDQLDAGRALSQRQAETIETLRTDLADVEANAEAYKAQRDRLREALVEAVAVWNKWLGNGGAPDLQAAGRKLRALLEPKNG